MLIFGPCFVENVKAVLKIFQGKIFEGKPHYLCIHVVKERLR